MVSSTLYRLLSLYKISPGNAVVELPVFDNMPTVEALTLTKSCLKGVFDSYSVKHGKAVITVQVDLIFDDRQSLAAPGVSPADVAKVQQSIIQWEHEQSSRFTEQEMKLGINVYANCVTMAYTAAVRSPGIHRQ